MRVLSFAVFALLAACASNSGVVPMGAGTFMVSRQAATGFSGPGNLKAQALQEANQHCAAQNKELEVLDTTEAKPPFIFGNYPRVEVQFRCVGAKQ
jgi:hypothetical protein